MFILHCLAVISGCQSHSCPYHTYQISSYHCCKMFKSLLLAHIPHLIKMRKKIMKICVQICQSYFGSEKKHLISECKLSGCYGYLIWTQYFDWVEQIQFLIKLYFSGNCQTVELQIKNKELHCLARNTCLVFYSRQQRSLWRKGFLLSTVVLLRTII